MTKDAARTYLLSELLNNSYESNRVSENDKRLIESVIENCLEDWKIVPKVAMVPGQFNAFLPFSYVIPDKDLEALKAVLSIVSAAGGSGYFIEILGYDPNKSVTAAITGIVAALLYVVNNLKSAVHLESQDYKILCLLAGKKNKGIITEDLLIMVQKSLPDFTLESLNNRLSYFKACPTVAGTKATLAWQDEAQLWYVNGL